MVAQRPRRRRGRADHRVADDRRGDPRARGPLLSLAAAETRYGCSSCRAVFRAGFARCPLDGTPLQQIVDDPLAGSIFADRYVIEGLIGEGGMGRVYRARHRRMSRKFAIKVLFGDHATDPKMRERFGREAESASRLSHPNVISVMDFGETEEGLLYLAMEYVDGRELATIIDEQAPLGPARIRRMMRQLCAGLGHAHDQALVHRDFKAANVIVSGSGDAEVCKIVDFGIAVLSEAGATRLTTEGLVLGTPAYMSPEQATGQDLDLRSDLFSLGVLLYEMLSGVLPFEGPPVAIARQNLAATPPPIRERVPGLEVDPALERLAHALMAKKREQRPQTAAEVLARLDRDEVPAAAAAPAPVEVPAEMPEPSEAPEAFAVTVATPAEQRAASAAPAPVPAATEQIDRASSRRTGVIVAIALVALLVAGGGWLVMRGRGGGDEHEAETLAAMPAAPADAGVVARDAPADAAPAVAPPVDAGAAVVVNQPGRRDAGKARRKPQAAPVDAGTPAATTAPVSVDDLQKLYVAVGAAVDRLEREQGAAVAGPYREKYLKIPFSDALRTPALRRDVEGTLKRLRGDVSRLLK